MGEETHSSTSVFWDQIDRAESYLVASMYEEAASLSASVLEGLCRDEFFDGPEESRDAMESAGMVLVQSLHCLGRASEIMNEIVRLFPSVAEIPVQVLLTGACLQISENFPIGVREVLEGFLSRWTYVEDEKYYVLVGVKSVLEDETDTCLRKTLEVDEYLEIAEVYAFTLLGMSLKDLGLAISWAEKASLPKELRQGLLRRLFSLRSAEASNKSLESPSVRMKDREVSHQVTKESKLRDESPAFLKLNNLTDGDDRNHSILRLSSNNSYLGWFPSVNLRFGGRRWLPVSNAKVSLGCLILLICYVLRKRRAAITGVVRRRATSIKQALVDFWRLAFSYQVNPLAAVQSLPVSSSGR